MSTSDRVVSIAACNAGSRVLAAYLRLTHMWRLPIPSTQSTYIAPGSWQASLDTAAAMLACLDATLHPAGSSTTTPATSSSGSGAVTSSNYGGNGPRAGDAEASSQCTAFCLGRPPGHHVPAGRPMGFGVSGRRLRH